MGIASCTTQLLPAPISVMLYHKYHNMELPPLRFPVTAAVANVGGGRKSFGRVLR